MMTTKARPQVDELLTVLQQASAAAQFPRVPVEELDSSWQRAKRMGPLTTPLEPGHASTLQRLQNVHTRGKQKLASLAVEIARLQAQHAALARLLE